LLGACALYLVLWKAQPVRISPPPAVGVVTPKNLEQLEGILRHGMSTQELLSVFGEPMGRYQYDDGLEIWAFGLSRKHMQEPWDEDIYGFDVRLTNGHLANWGFVYGIREWRHYGVGVPATERSDGQRAEDSEPLAMVFHIMPEGAFEGHDGLWWHAPEVTWHKNCEAEFVVEKVAKTETFRASDSTGYRGTGLALYLCKEDINAFEKFTGRHVGRTIVITLGGEVLATPIMSGPVRDGAIEVSHLKAEDVGQVLAKLKRLEGRCR